MPRLRFGPDTQKKRVRLGLSQMELGEKVNVSQATISSWERELSHPSKDQKAQIRGILGDSTGDVNSTEAEADESIELPSAIGVWVNRKRLEKNLSVPELATKADVSAVAIYNIESGRSQNPQTSTISKLELVLGSKLSSEALDEAKGDAYIEGVGEWFDFDPNRQDDWPNNAGFYVLYDVSNRPIYVGQGQSISHRLRDHQQKFWYKAPIVQTAAFVGIENKELREKIEKVLIKFLKSNAVLNQQNVDR